MAVLAGLEVGDPPQLWSDLGFEVADERCRVGALEVTFGGTGPGITSWTLAAADLSASDDDDHGPGGTAGAIDGLRTCFRESGPTSGPMKHPNAVMALDHLVVATPSLFRTVAELARYGILERRRRDSTRPGGPPSMQIFFRLGEAVLELVGSPDQDGVGPARFWGLAFTVSDLDVTAAALGPALRPVKAAVQPGRFIAALDRAAGSSVEMAFMTPG